MNTYKGIATIDDIAWNYFLHLKGVPPPIARLGVSMGSTETRQRKQSARPRNWHLMAWLTQHPSACANAEPKAWKRPG
eukprot:1156732-Pelagomonas_calceolata.AAC.7